MSQKIIIFDKDGTLTTTVSGEKFVQYPEDQKIIPGMDKALSKAKEMGYKIAVASNQMGIYFGYKTKKQANQEFEYLGTLFPEIEIAVFCPDEGETMSIVNYENQSIFTFYLSDCNTFIRDNGYDYQLNSFRKPEPGMLHFLIAFLEFDGKQNKIIYVGDREEDELAAAKAGIKFIKADLFKHNFSNLL